MNDVEKHKERLAQELLKIQKYFYSPEWLDLKADIEERLENTEMYLIEDNHIVCELTDSYNSMLHYTTDVMEYYYGKVSLELVRASIKLVIDYNKQKFYHFPWLWESRDTIRYSKKDLYRGEREVYLNLLNLAESYLKNIWQDKEGKDNKGEVWLDSLWSWIWISS